MIISLGKRSGKRERTAYNDNSAVLNSLVCRVKSCFGVSGRASAIIVLSLIRNVYNTVCHRSVIGFRDRIIIGEEGIHQNVDSIVLGHFSVSIEVKILICGISIVEEGVQQNIDSIVFGHFSVTVCISRDKLVIYLNERVSVFSCVGLCGRACVSVKLEACISISESIRPNSGKWIIYNRLYERLTTIKRKISNAYYTLGYLYTLKREAKAECPFANAHYSLRNLYACEVNAISKCFISNLCYSVRNGISSPCFRDRISNKLGFFLVKENSVHVAIIIVAFNNVDPLKRSAIVK